MRRFAACAALLSTLAVVRFAWSHAFSFYDDAYIYFRYAENVARGCGLDFRCEGAAPVEGFTSPLYMALLLVARVFTAQLETCALLIGCVCVALTLWLAALSAGSKSWLAGVAVLALLGCDDFVLLNAVTGLETALFMACAMGATWAALSEHASLSAWLVACAWVRPEGLLLFALAPHLRTLLPASAALLALLLARWLYYGDLLPNTYYAKSGGTPAHLELGFLYGVEIVRAYPLILAAPALLLRERRIAMALLGTAAVLMASFLRSGGDLFEYGRLFVPWVAPLYVCASRGLATLRLPGWTAAPVFAGALLALFTHRLAAQHGFPNVLRWSAVGSWLRCAHPGARIATVPVGAISYRSLAPVIDLVGLTCREIAHAGKTVPPERLTRAWIGHERHDTAWVLTQQPALIVLGAKFSAQPLYGVEPMRAGFWAEWELLQLAKQGRIPYRAYSPEVAPGVFWHMLRAEGTPDHSAAHCEAPGSDVHVPVIASGRAALP